MSHGYKVDGLEWMIEKVWDGQQVDILLYLDDPDRDGDDLDEFSTLDDIETEPDDGNYARFSFLIDDPEITSEGKEVRLEFGDTDFDVTDTTGEVDAFGIVVDDGSDDVLVGTGPLDDTYNLAQYSGSWSLPTGATLVPMY